MTLAHTDMRKSRVLVAAAGLFVGLALIWVRVGWLSLVRHAHFAERAANSQEMRVLVRPVRGDLLDRHGRPLARDLVTYEVTASPRDMPDPRATARTLARLLERDARSLMREFAERRRHVVVARRVPPEVGQAILDARLPAVRLAAETRRDYTLGEAAQEILGRTNLDHTGVEGLELQLDEALRGRPGWTTRFRDGRGRTVTLPRGLERRPEDGADAVLTLDADLQAILDTHLRRAVDTLDAVRGFALFLDPRTGEILASANAPHLGPGEARNWSFTDQYEPGSTYKIVAAAAALEEGLATPDRVFEAAESGRALVAPGCVLVDTHEGAAFSFRDAIRWSSNIVLGRLGLALGDERLYRWSTAFGFGTLTGIAFPGEVAGTLRSPAKWSARSAPTIAIGHEVAVTPLQLALAYAAVANGGVLMQPMLVREVREPSGAVRRTRPQAVRRVFSERTARVLAEMLQAVVDSGTARPARVAGLRIAGKTGTADKYDAATGTYGHRMYVASFVGFAPADDPRLVGVVVIDEPRGRRYFGGEVAAPVFREVMRDLQRLPRGPFAPEVRTVAARPPAPAPVTVPDVRLLPPRAAERVLGDVGLRARAVGAGARVLDQSPAAGAAVERGTGVTVWLEAPRDSAWAVAPALEGLALREALRRLGPLAATVRVAGRGVVVRQAPAPGARLPASREVRLWCEPRPLARAAAGSDAVVAQVRP
uniref:PASTA domain-containing protein n=1 Tax=Eiseniibacteriota bacterium TaxID=2212470 RepID=A0A832I2P1_UNCEI